MGDVKYGYVINSFLFDNNNILNNQCSMRNMYNNTNQIPPHYINAVDVNTTINNTENHMNDIGRLTKRNNNEIYHQLYHPQLHQQLTNNNNNNYINNNDGSRNTQNQQHIGTSSIDHNNSNSVITGSTNHLNNVNNSSTIHNNSNSVITGSKPHLNNVNTSSIRHNSSNSVITGSKNHLNNVDTSSIKHNNSNSIITSSTGHNSSVNTKPSRDNNNKNDIYMNIDQFENNTVIIENTDNCNIKHANIMEYNDNEIQINYDYDLSQDVGYFYNKSDVMLGHGSYGNVYLATDENGKKVAIKCCNVGKKGIPNILETSIMSSIMHPYLNHAYRICSTKEKLYIIQELAVRDLSRHTRKINVQSDIYQLKKWCFQICHAVACLHKNNIIHADIKASNILLYDNDNVKLSDFTLSTKKWDHHQTFTHNVCTCTHRPLECLMGQPWDESLDIWSLGCTLYEIAYGDFLFPYQGLLTPDHKIKDEEDKIKLRKRCVNAIIDWGTHGPCSQTLHVQQYPINYMPYKLHEHFTLDNDKTNDLEKIERTSLNRLICKMLMVDPARRPSIFELLNESFFKDLNAPIYMTITRPENDIPAIERTRVRGYIQRYSDHPKVQSVALSLYLKCNGILNISEHTKAAGVTRIASKLVLGCSSKIAFPDEVLLDVETEICHNLVFRLHIINS